MAKDIEQALKNAALNSDMSMLELSRTSEVPYSAVHGFLTGERRISLRSAAKLAKTLGLTLTRKRK